MKILVINSGSSSIKFQLIDMQSRFVLCQGLVERIGIKDSFFHFKPTGKEKTEEVRDIPDHRTGLELFLKAIVNPSTGILKNLSDIEAVGHRMILGGEKISQAVLLDEDLIRGLEELNKLAPLHNPPTILGFRAARNLLPGRPHIGVFDSAFHTTIPQVSYMYALAYEYYEKYGIRKFGYHGPSHKYVSRRGAEILGKKNDEFNCITAHFGNGVSITAIKNGKSVDTSLGFGTMCGVPMGTRAGDVDPDVILYLIETLGMSIEKVRTLIYQQSGLKGLSGLTNDLRDIVKAAGAGNRRAALALDVFAHRARRYIAALATNLTDGIDALIFTAGIGENSPEVREKVCHGLEIIGVRIDLSKNRIQGEEAIISTADSQVTILVIPTNEELMIALETEDAIKRYNRG
ncbi:MAG: acetate kinase [Spirochaetota bacterium]